MNLASTLERAPVAILRPASVRLSRLLSAPPERIFDAWLDAGAARAFLFAARTGGNAISSEIDGRVGGGFRIVRHGTAEDVEYSGEYLEIDRPHRLVFSLSVEKYAQQDDRVIVELAAVASQSLLVLTHEFSLPNLAERFRIQREWAKVLAGLEALCTQGGAYEERRRPAPDARGRREVTYLLSTRRRTISPML